MNLMLLEDFEDSFILLFSIIGGAIVRRHGCRHVERGYRMCPSLNERFLSLFISEKRVIIACAKRFKL